MKIVVIPDTQVRPGVPLDHLYAANNYIKDIQPDIVLHLGDHWDLPSISSHESMVNHAFEKRSLKADIEWGNEGLRILDHKLPKSVRKIFLDGNHENRLDRLWKEHPVLKNSIDLDYGDWEVYQFLEVLELDRINFSHYFYHPMNGRAITGQVANMLNRLGFSFVQGHRQELSFGRKDLNNGTSIVGLVAGAFYMHEEGYKGPQGNDHWRGIVVLDTLGNGDADLTTISLSRLLEGWL